MSWLLNARRRLFIKAAKKPKMILKELQRSIGQIREQKTTYAYTHTVSKVNLVKPVNHTDMIKSRVGVKPIGSSCCKATVVTTAAS